MATDAIDLNAPTAEAPAVEASADAADVDLPKAVVQRIVRSKAFQMIEAAQKTGGGAAGADKKPPNVQISKDALLAFSESAKVFINYLASTANDFAKEGKRVTISATDVFKALEELEFVELVQPLQQYLEAHKGTLKEKPAAAKKKEGGSTAKKRKMDTPAAAEEARPAAEAQPSPLPLPALQQESAAQDAAEGAAE